MQVLTEETYKGNAADVWSLGVMLYVMIEGAPAPHTTRPAPLPHTAPPPGSSSGACPWRRWLHYSLPFK